MLEWMLTRFLFKPSRLGAAMRGNDTRELAAAIHEHNREVLSVRGCGEYRRLCRRYETLRQRFSS